MTLVCATFLITTESLTTYAYDGPVNLTEFVTPLTAISTAGFSISSGEFIRYASAPGDVSGTVRMFKNSNWEQFVVDGGFIRRREDTSWAPAPAGEPGAPDVFCENGHRAVYTLVNDGQPINGNAQWLPVSLNFVASKANHDAAGISIYPVDVTALDARVGCKLKGSLSSIYPASGQSQSMELTYHLANTFTFCSGLKNEADLIDILVTGGFGSGDHFYFMRGWGFVGFQDPTGRNAGLGSGGTCAGGGGSPGPGGEPGSITEPSCSIGPFNLTIKGTIKSSNVFLQSADPVTGDSVFEDVRLLPAGIVGDIPYVKNVPVNGAIIQLHDSQKIPGHEYNSGTIDGMLKQSYKSVRTKPDGTFTIEAVSHCGPEGNVYRDDWRGRGYEQFLTVSCENKSIGESAPRMVVVDALGYLLNTKGTGESTVASLQDLNVDCPAIPWKTYPGVSKPTGHLKIAARSKEVYLACSGTKRVAADGNPGVTYPKRKSNVDLIFKDEWSKSSAIGILRDLLGWIGDTFGGCGSEDKGCWARWLEEHTPFRGRTEGRDDINTQLFATEEHAVLIDTLLGIRDEIAARPLYFLNGAPATYDGRPIETYNGHEEKPQLVDCENYRRCSQALSEPDHPLDNMQTCGGTAFTLGTPYGNVIRTASGQIDPYLSGDAIRYLGLPRTREICVDKSGGSEKIVTVADVIPLEGYCGDIDNNNQIDVPIERPCPNSFSCGDYNGDGDATDDGERPCSSLRMQNADNPSRYDAPSIYKYDIRYFPYSLLYNTETVNYNQAESHTNRTVDSYDNVCPHGDANHGGDGTGYDAKEGPGGVSKPADSVCEGVNGSYTFYQQIETKFPCTDSLCYKKNEATENTNDGRIPPVGLAATPQFPDTSDSRAYVEQTVVGVGQTITTSKKGNFYRIGIPDDLCSCSLVENGTNGDLAKPLANCLGDASLGSVPKANEPANITDPTKDEALGGDNQIRSYVTYASPIMGGYDYELAKKPRSADGSQQEKHYEQTTTGFSVSQAVTDMLDAVSCAFNDGAVHDGNGVLIDNERRINCGRVIRKTAQSTLMVRGTIPPLAKLGLALLNILDAPFTDQLDMRSAGVVDATKTKLELKADGNSYGLDLAKWGSNEVPGSQGSGYNIDRGVPKKKDRDDFMNSVSNPVFTGYETPACKTVTGWNITEYASEGLFTVDCLEDASKCWVGGAVNNEDWDGGTLIMASSDQGGTWTKDPIAGATWIHGISVYDTVRVGVGRVGSVYRETGGVWSVDWPLTKYTGEHYSQFLYDIAGGPGGYIATGTGHVFYSPDGVNGWKDLGKNDYTDASGNPVVGCKDPDWPYGCIGYDSAHPTACGVGATPPCCCEGSVSNPDPDSNPLTSFCPNGTRGGDAPACWKWSDSSIWGVDCNKSGDCIIAGQHSPKTWRSLASGLGNVDSWIRTLLPNGGHAMNISFPGGPTGGVAYIVGGAGNGGDDTGAFIFKTTDGGVNWVPQSLAGIDTGLKGIDCFSENDCVAVGNFGTIIITSNGGATWTEAWKSGADIAKAKTDKVRFWDVAYPNKNTIIAVGFKPNAGDPNKVDGVIYSLGEKEDCGESSGTCTPVSGVQVGKKDQCSPAMSVTWSNNNTVMITGDYPTPDLGSANLTSIKGSIKVRDPNTLGSSAKLAISGCNNKRGCGQTSGFFTVPTLWMKYLSKEYVFKIDTDLYSSCGAVTDIILDLSVPVGSEIELNTKGDSTGGPASACLDNMRYRGNVSGALCFAGYAWSQSPGCPDGTDCTSCNISLGGDWCTDDEYSNGATECNGPGCTGLFRARELGYPTGLAPVSCGTPI